MLSNVFGQLEADGCLLELSEASSKLATPNDLIAGDFVRVRLWLEDDGAFIDIRLAEVTRVQNHWIAVEVIQVSSQDRLRLKRFVDARAAMHQEQPAQLNRILVRA
ncbi:MAG TPA: hypothetical protein VLE03_04795 [Nitrospiraceae bacterium]|nr:hypothetical protein [Nitrospiraceae bacterium]